jgi:hypothetical protein
MKVFLQLLREFWLPLLLGIAWTVFNFVDRPITLWTVREILNVFGPTFFFISWLVAQWYRVKKQQRVEHGLTEIQKDVRAIYSPLLPCGLFITLRYEATDHDLDLVFQGESGFRAFAPGQPMPPPPVGLPPGMTDGRVFRSGGYFEYQHGVLSAAGFFNQSHPGYNPIHCAVTHTVSSLSREKLAAVKQSNLLLAAPSVNVHLYFQGRPKSNNVKPSLTLVSVHKTHEIAAANAIDNSVFVDQAIHLVPEPANQMQNWSTADLNGTFLQVTLRFFYIEPMLSLSKESWPVMHNLQLWLGPKADKLFTFDLTQLSSQIVREDPNPIAVGQAKCIQVQFEYKIDAAAYSKGLLASA